MTERTNEEGWIEWAGGECPVDADVYVQIKYKALPYELEPPVRDTPQRAGSYWWDHRPAAWSGDIIAYRVTPIEEIIVAHRSTFPEDGWFEWNGGAQPVDDQVLVEVKLRDGTIYDDTGSELAWSHDRVRIGMGTDIIAYRVVTTP